MIDSHQHVFWHGRDDTDLVVDMDEQGIDTAWLLSWVIMSAEDSSSNHAALNPEHMRGDGTHAGIPLSDLIRARNHYPDRFVLGYCPHPCYGDAVGLFESAVRMHGVRVCGEWKFRIPFDDDRCLNLFSKAGELECPVVLHLDSPYLKHPQCDDRVYQPNWHGGGIDRLERVLADCAKTNFIGHAAGFWRHISADSDCDTQVYATGPIKPGGRLELLFDRYPNLYADLSAKSALSALQRDLQYSRALLERHADRFLFGRDCYGGDLIACLKKLELSDDTWVAITSDNAQRLVPIIDGCRKPISDRSLKYAYRSEQGIRI